MLSILASHTLYVDGSLQTDGSAGCAVISSTMEPPDGHRLQDWSNCEMHVLLILLASPPTNLKPIA